MRVVAGIVAALAISTTAGAQSQSVLTGTVVVDATPSPPLGDAEIAVPGLKLVAHTDSSGRFFFNNIPKGSFRVTVRRVGYSGMAVNAKFSGSDTLAADFALTPLTVTLDTVSVKGKAPVYGKFQEFEDRRHTGFGAFMTREQIDKERDRPLGELMTRFPGVRVQRYGSEAAIASHRGGVRRIDAFDRRKGAPNACYAQVYLDGVRVYGGEAGEPLFNINMIEASSIEGIEYYASAV
ncbi:MAG: carboxypeptidase-like regulatory domain-containing protein, partial [Gemmatimonadaceae bacterium]